MQGGAVGVVSSLISSSQFVTKSESATPTNGSWLAVSSDETLTESLVSTEDGKCLNNIISLLLINSALLLDPTVLATPITRGHWVSFLDGLQRVLLFTHDVGILDRLRACDHSTHNKLQLSLLIRSIGVSLVNNVGSKEVAYIGITQ